MSTGSAVAHPLPLPQRRKLAAETVPVAGVDAATRAAAFVLFESLYEGADAERFGSDFAEKQRVILLRDAESGELKGFSTVRLEEVETARGSATVVFSGDTAIDPAYWGQKRLQREFSRLLVREKLRRPLRPLFWFLVSKGYRSYLLLARSLPCSLPRCDRVEDTEHRRIVDLLAERRFGDRYDRATGIVVNRDGHERVRHGVAELDEALLRDPHVAFFVERNPGFAEGDELACLAEIRLIDPLLVIARSFGARRGRR